MPNLIVLAGLPGSGKSTWAQTFFDQKYAIVSPDAERERLYGGRAICWATPESAKESNKAVWETVTHKVEDYLKHAVDVVLDATSLWAPGRRDFIKLAHDNGAKAHLILFKNIQEAMDRNFTREPDHIVPEEAFARMFDLYHDTLAQVVQEDWNSVTKVESAK